MVTLTGNQLGLVIRGEGNRAAGRVSGSARRKFPNVVRIVPVVEPCGLPILLFRAYVVIYANVDFFELPRFLLMQQNKLALSQTFPKRPSEDDRRVFISIRKPGYVYFKAVW